jgi:gamma-glutamyltranspeptidase
MSTEAMAATSQPLATETALQVMRDGGNALDAAIAASAVLSVVETYSSGIGGDCFILYHENASGKLHALNGSGRPPCPVRSMRGTGQTASSAMPISRPCCSPQSITPRPVTR